MNELQVKLDKIQLEKDTKLLPENLKAGVECLGITGTLEPFSKYEYIKPFSTVTKLTLNKTITLKDRDLYDDTSLGGGFDNSNRWINWLDAHSDMFCSTQIQEKTIYISFAPRLVNESDSYGYDKTLINAAYYSEDGINFTLAEDELLMYKEMWEQENIIGRFFDLDTTTWTFTFKEDQLLGDVGPNEDNSVTVDLEWTEDFASPFIVKQLEALDTTDATATINDIANGKTAYVKGEKITGTLIPAEDLNTELAVQDEVITRQQEQINNLLLTLDAKGSSGNLSYTELFNIATDIYNTGIEDDSDTVNFTVNDEQICLQRALKILRGGI